MEKIIKIGDKEVKFKSTGSAPLRYKMQFKRDLFADIMKMQNMNMDNLETLDLETFYNVAWLFAKTADSTILPPLEWLDTFEVFPIVQIVTDIQDLLTSSLGVINQKN